VKGAALIFQKRTNATEFCSSVLGRNLFKWYNLIEDECCLLLCDRSALPKSWRHEDLRIRKLIAMDDYSRVSKDQLQSRILDDVLQATLTVIPSMIDAIATIPELNRSVGNKRAKTILYLESKLIYIFDHVITLKNSRLVKELLQTIEVGFPWKTRHSTCCPQLPFPPFRFLYPPGGMVFICLQAIRNYVQTVLYPPLKANGVRIEKLELESEFDEHNAYEMCRAYAAIEDEFGDDPSCLLSCFRPLSVAGFSCPQELRRWYWHKLAHFERLDPKYVEPVRRYLSVMWGMSELLTMDFESSKLTSLENPMITLTVEDIDTAAKIVITTDDSERSEETDTE
jgi:hypothetical protein